jgi:hypothetical protein
MAVAPAFADDEVKRNGAAAVAMGIWFAGLAVMLVPAIVAWIVRVVGYAVHCEPSAPQCLGSPFDAILGAILRGSLDLSWLVSTTVPFTLGITFLAALAAVVALRPVTAALTVLIAPLAAILLPTFIVGATTYDGCQINPDGLGDCKVWGEPMGMAFHTAATATQLLYTYTPIVAAGALVVGLFGWLVLWGSKQMKKA